MTRTAPGSRKGRLGEHHERVDGVAVLGEGLGHEPVVAGIAGRGEEHPVQPDAASAWSYSYLFRDPLGISTMTSTSAGTSSSTHTTLLPGRARPAHRRRDLDPATGPRQAGAGSGAVAEDRPGVAAAHRVAEVPAVPAHHAGGGDPVARSSRRSPAGRSTPRTTRRPCRSTRRSSRADATSCRDHAGRRRAVAVPVADDRAVGGRRSRSARRGCGAVVGPRRYQLPPGPRPGSCAVAVPVADDRRRRRAVGEARRPCRGALVLRRYQVLAADDAGGVGAVAVPVADDRDAPAQP